MADALTIGGVELDLTAEWSYRDITRKQTIEFGCEVGEPDPDWSHVDSAGHFHAWAVDDLASDGKPQLPSLVPATTRTLCPNGPGCACDGEGSVETTWRCVWCREKVEPARRGAGQFSKEIVTSVDGVLAVRTPFDNAIATGLLPTPDGVGIIIPLPTFTRRVAHVRGVIDGVLRFGPMDVGPPGMDMLDMARHGDRAIVRVELTGRLHRGIGAPAVEAASTGGRTGGGGKPWVEFDSPRPAAVADHYAHWGEAPPELSGRCQWWVRQIGRGWRPNLRYRTEGYDGAAELYGVWIWEYLHVIHPLVRGHDEIDLDRQRPSNP